MPFLEFKKAIFKRLFSWTCSQGNIYGILGPSCYEWAQNQKKSFSFGGHIKDMTTAGNNVETNDARLWG